MPQVVRQRSGTQIGRIMKPAQHRSDAESPAIALDRLAKNAIAVAKKARKYYKGLGADNFYGNKLADLRADATNAFRELDSHSAGDASALAELIEEVFSTQTKPVERLTAARELSHALRTTWKQPRISKTTRDEGIFPLTILAQAKKRLSRHHRSADERMLCGGMV